MKRVALPVLALGAALIVSACGNNAVDRMATGAGIGAATGAGIGLVAGGVGVLPGALVGAAVGGAGGLITTSDQVDLGQPVWRR